MSPKQMQIQLVRIKIGQLSMISGCLDGLERIIPPHRTDLIRILISVRADVKFLQDELKYIWYPKTYTRSKNGEIVKLNKGALTNG